MKHPDFVRLPPALEPAAQTLKLAARLAVERTIESLGLAALAAGSALNRDGLLAAQFELNRKSAVFALSFNEAFDERVLRELGSPTESAAPRQDAAGPASWESLSLVGDHEVEQQISADRFGLAVAHACEWELREFDAFVAALLPGPQAGAGPVHNPLRPQVVGHAMVRAIEAVSERPDVRKQLASEVSRSLAVVLRSAYADIARDLRQAGVQPRGLSVRPRPSSTAAGGPGTEASGRARAAGGAFGADTAQGRYAQHTQHSEYSQYSSYGRSGFSGPGGLAGAGVYGADGSLHGHNQPGARHWGTAAAHQDPMMGVPRPAPHRSGWDVGAPARPSLGAVDPKLMSLIRRLSQDVGRSDGAGFGQTAHEANSPSPLTAAGEPLDAAPASPNLILAHREALRQASRGALDHLVIDVIAGLFDQILADPKVPPQLARLIARLQLPVLRAALGDSSFFSSRRHPVRRFINRIASLGAAFDDYGTPSAQRFLAKVRALIDAVVEGDFEQLELYEATLRELEAFMAAPAPAAAADAGATAQAAELLAQREDELQLRRLYAQRLEGELRALAGPEFVRDFIIRVWSQVLVRASAAARAAGDEAAESAVVQQLRQTGRDLFMSVQPKATPAARKTFLAGLPRLMQELTEGMNLIAWPEDQRRSFFGQLMPAHAEALKNAGVTQLDINLLARQVETALAQPVPTALELRAATGSGRPIGGEESEAPLAGLTAAEAVQVGLVAEAAIDWHAPTVPPPEPKSAAEAEAAALPASEPLLPGAPLPAQPAEAPEPTQGAALADHVQLGYAYQMQLDGQWQKVRLAHVSPARSFFIFSHGSERASRMVTLSRRMLDKLCAAGRLRAYEQAYLVERSTARARRQLALLATQG